MPRPVRYLFESEWTVPARRVDVLAVLRELDGYERWWPQVRESQRLSTHTVRMRCRSVLPYDLGFIVIERCEDPARGRLAGELVGDLQGTSSWTLSDDGERTRVRFREEVVTTRWALNVLAPVARRLFEVNHARMMRDGEAGLRAAVAGRPAAVPADDDRPAVSPEAG